MTIERWRSVLVNREVGSISQHFRHPGRGQPTLRQLFWTASAVATGSGVRMWAPVLDMHETKDDLVLNFELPGVREKDVSPVYHRRSADGEGGTLDAPPSRYDGPSPSACGAS